VQAIAWPEYGATMSKKHYILCGKLFIDFIAEKVYI